VNLKQLEYFVAIAEEHQITAAARRLHISQPPLSYELAQLERELGTTLVRRGPRSATLTDAGKLLYERALRILALAQATKRDVEGVGKGMAGVLTLGVDASCVGSVPGSRLAELATVPDVSVELREGDTSQVLEMLEGGVVDIGVVRTPFPSDGLRCRYARAERMLAIMPPALEVGTEMDVTCAQLSDVPVILTRRLEAQVRDAFADAKANLLASCTVDDPRTACTWARNGMGVALVPETLLPVTDTGECFIKVIAEKGLSTRQAVVWKADRYMSPLAQRCLALLGDLG
jgi:DNA-binding transcriptional LysR family regulator